MVLVDSCKGIACGTLLIETSRRHVFCKLRLEDLRQAFALVVGHPHGPLLLPCVPVFSKSLAKTRFVNLTRTDAEYTAPPQNSAVRIQIPRQKSEKTLHAPTAQLILRASLQIYSLRQPSIRAVMPCTRNSESRPLMEEHYFSPEMLLSQDGYYRPLCPVDDQWVPAEVVNRWHHREQSRHLRDLHEREMLEFDAVLAELLYRRKQTLCRLGRNGQWSRWLKEQRISRSTADRLVEQYAASYGLVDELCHRESAEPLEGNVCLAAQRTHKRLKKMLGTPQSRITFLRCMANLFGLEVELSGDGSVLLTLSPPSNEGVLSDRVPNVIQVLDDGSVAPVDYELRDAEETAVEDAEPICF